MARFPERCDRSLVYDFSRWRATDTSQPTIISRRAWLGAAAGGAACGPKLAKRFNGYCFVANRGSRNLAVVNLTRFRLEKQIALEGAPVAVLPHSGGAAMLALTDDRSAIVEVPAATLAVSRVFGLAGRALEMRLAGGRLWVLCRDPHRLEQVELRTWKQGRPIALAHAPGDFDIDSGGAAAVVSFVGKRDCALIDLGRGAVTAEIALSAEAGVVRFRPDGKQVLAGSAAGKSITTVDPMTARVQVVLPLPFAPERLCFSTDNGGQMFATGQGMDAVGIVYPYKTELGETILAGREPGAMTVNDSLLFVANPPAGDVTVIGIAERQVVARISSGEGPCAIALTPDGEYGLVVNGGSGSLAVVRLSKLTDLRYKRAPLFTVVPVGEDPVAAAVCRL